MYPGRKVCTFVGIVGHTKILHDKDRIFVRIMRNMQTKDVSKIGIIL
jgi:hypothetical protein